MPEQHESMSVPHVYNMGFSEKLKRIHSDAVVFRTNASLNRLKIVSFILVLFPPTFLFQPQHHIKEGPSKWASCSFI